MAILSIKKMTLIGLESEKSRVLKTLQALSAFELIDVDEQIKEECNKQIDANLSEIETGLNDAKACIDFLKKYDVSKKSLVPKKPEYTENQITALDALKEEALPIMQKAKELEKQLSDQKSRATYLNSMKLQLLPWAALDIPLEEIKSTKTCRVMIGYLANEKDNTFLEATKEFEGFYLQEVSVDKDKKAVFIVCLNEKYPELLEILKEHSWQEIQFAGHMGTAKHQIEMIDTELQTIETLKLEVEEQSAAVARFYEKVGAYYDALSNELSKRNTVYKTVNTDKAFVMQGWIVDKDKELIKQELLKADPDLYLEFTEPTEDDDIPTVLNNPRIIEPFEAVTDLYSKPSARGFDPNFLMAPFYFMFFGMMVSDAGYGIVVSILATTALLVLKPDGMLKKLMSLIAICGISTLIWGALFGGWFGVSLKPIWFNPLQEPMMMLIVCYAFGVVHIFTAMCIAAYMSIKRGDLFAAFFDQIVWMILLISLPLLAVPQAAPIAKWVAIAATAALVLTQGRGQKSIIKKLLSGILSLYNVTGYLSDVLSYSRLFALGLATSVIAMVINTVAGMMAGNFIGNIFMVLILIGGHIFNIAINVLGAYVHSSRLQYIEFFGKFYEAGGRTFKPLSYKTKYIKLKKQEIEG